jgi:uncharacterized protein YcfJ
MTSNFRRALLSSALVLSAPAWAQVTLYEDSDFGGRSITTQQPLASLNGARFNDRASSVVVTNDRWEVCEDVRYGGRCVVLRQGNYPSLAAMGLNDRISSVRRIGANVRIDDSRYAPMPVVQHDYRRRAGERLYEAQVLSVHAVMGTPEQRCWIEREEVPADRGPANVPGAVFGAVIGGILGHQIGGGTGRDIATAGGVIGGAAIGANVGRNTAPTSREVQRCRNVGGPARPEYWDVSYNFRGQMHSVQMTAPPGPTITVNRQGEPRVPG